jgi:hypothetical protein
LAAIAIFSPLASQLYQLLILTINYIRTMTVILCPGVHPPELTESFLRGLGGQLADYLVFPSDIYPSYSPLHVLDFLSRQFTIPRQASLCWHNLPKLPLLFVGFSAGVVGAVGAAWAWQSTGRIVKALIAVDGWGVPLYGNFPIHRLSHDAFTHHSSASWGQGNSFYADPPTSHLELWRSPHRVQGWQVTPTDPSNWGMEQKTPTTAAEFLMVLLAQYDEMSLA